MKLAFISLLMFPALAQIAPPGGAGAPPPTYSAAFSPSASGTAVAASTTDFWCIAGGSKGVFITKITLTGAAAAANLVGRINLVLRSSLDTGGTPTTITAVPHDSTNAAATATVTSFAANPGALGTAVATLKGYIDVIQSTASGMPPGPFIALQESWGAIRGVQPLVLRGATQAACLNSNGATSLTNAMVNVEWYEQ